MSVMASQITSLTAVYSTVYSGTDQTKYQNSASLAFVRGIHRGPVNSPHKGPVTREMFPFDGVTMKTERSYQWIDKMSSVFDTYFNKQCVEVSSDNEVLLRGSLTRLLLHSIIGQVTPGGIGNLGHYWPWVMSCGLICLHWLTLIPACISNQAPSKIWDEITYSFPNFNGSTVEVWEWISYLTPQFIMGVLTYPCWDLR